MVGHSWRLRIPVQAYPRPTPKGAAEILSIAEFPGHGSGLGLAIVEEVARLYGASVSIGTGTKEVGTRIVVLFP